MLTEKPQDAPAKAATAAPAATPVDELFTYFEGQYVPLKDARVNIMTHAFMYGTAVFEGIRAYWNADEGVLYGLKFREHLDRIRRNAGMLLMRDLPSVDELVEIVTEVTRRNDFH
jgi:branched-chain amino acid aminotransferase